MPKALVLLTVILGSLMTFQSASSQHILGDWELSRLEFPHLQTAIELYGMSIGNSGIIYFQTERGTFQYDGDELALMNTPVALITNHHYNLVVNDTSILFNSVKGSYQAEINTGCFGSVDKLDLPDDIDRIFVDSKSQTLYLISNSKLIEYNSESSYKEVIDLSGRTRSLQYLFMDKRDRIWLRYTDSYTCLAVNRTTGEIVDSIESRGLWTNNDEIFTLDAALQIHSFKEKSNSRIATGARLTCSDPGIFLATSNFHGVSWIVSPSAKCMIWNEKDPGVLQNNKLPLRTSIECIVPHPNSGHVFVLTKDEILQAIPPTPGIKKYLNSPFPESSASGISTRAMWQRDDHHILVASYDGIFEIDLLSDSVKLVKDFLVSENPKLVIPAIWDFAKSDSHIFVTTETAHIFKLNIDDLSEELVPYPEKEYNVNYKYITEVNNEYWFSGGGSISRLLPEEKSLRAVRKLGHLDVSELRLFESLNEGDSIIWFAGKKGLLRLDIEQNEVEEFSTPGGTVMYCIQPGNNSIWVGGVGGLFEFDKRTKSFTRHFNSGNGLADDDVTALIAVDNKLWISTYGGLTLADPDKNMFHHLEFEDGLTHKEFNRSSALKLRDGRIAFGGLNGIQIIDPSVLFKPVDSARLIITAFYEKDDGGDWHSVCARESVLEIDSDFLEIDWSTDELFDRGQYYVAINGKRGWQYLDDDHRIRMNVSHEDNLLLHLGLFNVGGQLLSEYTIRVKNYYRDQPVTQFVVLGGAFLSFLIIGFYTVKRDRRKKNKGNEMLSESEDISQEVEVMHLTPYTSIEIKADLTGEDIKDLLRLEQFILDSIANENFKVADIEQFLNLSNRQTHRRVKQISGLTPGQLIRACRLSEAKRLLRDYSTKSVAEVAYETGFKSPEYFSKVFQKRYGLNPSQIKKL